MISPWDISPTAVKSLEWKKTGQNFTTYTIVPPQDGVWKNPAEKTEWEVVKQVQTFFENCTYFQAFDFFVGADCKFNPLTLTKVVILNNPLHQKNFEAKYKSISASKSAEIPWMKTENDKLEWRSHIMAQFSKYVQNVTGLYFSWNVCFLLLFVRKITSKFR